VKEGSIEFSAFCRISQTFAQLVAESESTKGRIVLYAVFGDESHDEAGARVFAVAGLFGSEDDWGHLSEKWLARTGGKVFHAAECESNNGSFFGSTNAENKRLYKDLIQVACASRLMGRAHAMDLVGWNKFFPNAEDEMPYLTCFRNVIQECGDLAFLSIPRANVKFTFDQRIETNYNARSLYSYMAKWENWSASSLLHEEISFASRKYVGVQVADLIARETMKHLDNIVGPIKRGTRLSMRELQNTGRFRFTYYTREWFRGFRSHFEEVSRSLGMEPTEYRDWLTKNGLADCMSSKHRYMFWKYPQGPKLKR